MYRDRNTFPHQLSYSAVGSLQSNRIDFSPQVSQYTKRDEIEKNESDNRRFLKPQQNSDLAFLRHTVGPIINTDLGYLRVNDPKKIDISLRQTMNLTSDFKKVIRPEGPLTQKRTSRVQTVPDVQQNHNISPYVAKNDDRLSKIMEKFDKKNQTKEALKLLEELKQLKKKQQELKNQRKINPAKETQNLKKNTGNQYEVNSPISFSKKNKIDHYTPIYEKKSLSTNANSPQNIESSFNQFGQKNIYDLQRQNSSISVKSQAYETIPKRNSLTQAVESLSASLYQVKLNGNNYQYHSGNQTQSKGFVKDKTSNNLQSNEPESFKKPYRPVANSNTVNATTRDMPNFSKSPLHKYKDSPSSFSSKISFSRYQNGQQKSYPLSSTLSSRSNVKDGFMNKKLSINDFVLGRNLGEGKFGTVYQAFEKRAKSIYALKKISKSTIKSHWMIDQFLLEVKIQQFCNHPNILSLHGVFDDTDSVYILLEYMEEGTLFLHLKKNATLNQKQAAIKIKQIASAIQYLHENGIAHRDLKPENIVISHGVCKLCDFGWATVCDERRKTYCGTFDYAAPEILEGEEYDMSVDLWCLGILTYEILVGKAPFYHISRKETMKKIMNVLLKNIQCQNELIAYPSSMSHEARSFIEQLLKRNPEQRLKSEDLLKHPFILMADK